MEYVVLAGIAEPVGLAVLVAGTAVVERLTQESMRIFPNSWIASTASVLMLRLDENRCSSSQRTSGSLFNSGKASTDPQSRS